MTRPPYTVIAITDPYAGVPYIKIEIEFADGERYVASACIMLGEPIGKQDVFVHLRPTRQGPDVILLRDLQDGEDASEHRARDLIIRVARELLEDYAAQRLEDQGEDA